ncbi:Protein kinase-like domain [Fusarium austroafricanum]|uniref:Protein kinase-like domain n=1 Tax=Fusarium austroafricanum TaxID=2364996 RepID=A0A8H4P8R7_9HYPO|nr:Protein kinase-like domain [Fusarium austroafricanum]
MALASNDKDLIPDYSILSGIATIKDSVADLESTFKEKCHVIANNWTTCTFSLRLDTCPPSYPEQVLIRVETSNDNFETVAGIQNLAHSILPGLVPCVLDVGTTTNAKGEKLAYSVIEFVPDAINLDDEWNNLDGSTQKDLVSQVVAAIQKLQNLNLNSEQAQKALEGTPFYGDGRVARIGGPALGYFDDMAGFVVGLAGNATLEKTNFCVSKTDDGLVIQSTLDSVGRVQLTNSDLSELQQNAVFCHDDLEPRNVLIKRDNATGKWNMAAIIDWEMAGFFPFAYESAHKDSELGTGILSFSWYTLFKEQTRHLLSGGESAVKLLEALRTMDVSRKIRPSKNVGHNFQLRWLEREKVEFSSDMPRGWVRKPGAGPIPVFTKQDQDDLEMEILKEFGYV